MNNLSNIVITALEFVETYNNTDNKNKKERAIQFINKKINELPDDDNKRLLVSSLSIVDELIDVIVLASKNKIKINRGIKKLFCCLT